MALWRKASASPGRRSRRGDRESRKKKYFGLQNGESCWRRDFSGGYRCEHRPDFSGSHQQKSKKGTNDFLLKPAMSEREAMQAVRVGMELVKECKEAGYTLLGTGEMGIGNTTTSAAMAAKSAFRSAGDRGRTGRRIK